MFDLLSEIKRIAVENRARRGEEGGGESAVAPGGSGAVEGVFQAIEEFHRIGEEAVGLYNDAVGGEELWIVHTPPVVLRAFLHFNGERLGFSMLSRDRYAVFVDNPPQDVLVLGREIAQPGDQNKGKKSMIQLINLHIEGSGQGLRIRDSNGSLLDAREVMALVVRWVSR